MGMQHSSSLRGRREHEHEWTLAPPEANLGLRHPKDLAELALGSGEKEGTAFGGGAQGFPYFVLVPALLAWLLLDRPSARRAWE